MSARLEPRTITRRWICENTSTKGVQFSMDLEISFIDVFDEQREEHGELLHRRRHTLPQLH
jgi:hypothetical protein